jgi:hypothetical protein
VQSKEQLAPQHLTAPDDLNPEIENPPLLADDPKQFLARKFSPAAECVSLARKTVGGFKKLSAENS